MNPAQYKAAMQERASRRRAQKDDLQAREAREYMKPSTIKCRNLTAPAGGPADASGISHDQHYAATHPPRGGSSAHTRGKSLLSRFDRAESESSAATSVASSAGGGYSSGWQGDTFDREGSGLVLEKLGHLNANGEVLSPIAPGPLSRPWEDGRAQQFKGLDKQAGMTLVDVFGDAVEDEPPGFAKDRSWDVRELSWKRRPGETSITQGVRLYLENLRPDATHEENCALILHQILVRVATEELDVPALKTRHTIKLEAFLRSMVLSVPTRTWRQSVRGAFARTAPVGNSNPPNHGAHICKEELIFRMSLFVAIMKAEREGRNDADEAVDAMRVEAVVRGYAANAAEILPLQHPARTLLPPLLFCMACEMLGVRLLAPEVRDVCRQIVSDYEDRAKLWMTPAQNAERYLVPLVTEFASWLRGNKDILYQGSATEGLLRSIDGDLRSSLKDQVYRSPEHFLSVIDSLSPELTDMPLPSYDPAGGDGDHPFDVSQTLKDVSREKFDVNGVPINPSDCWREIRALLLKAATEHPEYEANSSELLADTGADLNADADLVNGETDSSEDKVLEDRRDDIKPAYDATVSSSCGDAAGGRRVSREGFHTTGGLSREGEGKPWELGSRSRGGVEGNRRESKSALELYVDQCTWRVLHAASRTASGGDCFFVVQDLFGGEGVLVKMASAATEPIKIRTQGMTVRVTTVDKHDIYHISDIDMPSCSSEASPRPLMAITTTMKEVIQFQPFTTKKSPISREATLQAENPSSDSSTATANMQPANAISGRFITISAGLPDYPEHYLDASVGVLTASPRAPLDSGRQEDGEDGLSDLDVERADTFPSDQSLPDGVSYHSRVPSHGPNGRGRRASAFTSPLPEPPSHVWHAREGEAADALNEANRDSSSIPDECLGVRGAETQAEDRPPRVEIR